jgi:membrane fusion protein, heavy metal efflux system
MSKSFKYSLLAWVCAHALTTWADTGSAAALPFLPMSEAQQAGVGIRSVKIQSASQASVLATAQVIPSPGKDVTISAPYAGQISKLLVGVGDKVKAGQALAEFTSPQLADTRRQWLEAKLELQNAQSALQRDEAMLAEGIIPAIRVQLTRNKYEVAKATWEARQSELQSAGLDVSASTSYASAPLRAAMSGTVSEAFGSVGQRIEAGTTLFKVTNDDKLQLDIQLSNDKASLLRPGDVVSIPTKSAKAKILGVSRTADATQSARARAVVEQRGQLIAGEWVSITVQSSSGNASASHWLVPARSITHFENQTLIFVKQDKGYMPQHVKVISSNDDSALIEAIHTDNAPPLNADTRVAIQGIVSLRAMLQKDE